MLVLCRPDNRAVLSLSLYLPVGLQVNCEQPGLADLYTTVPLHKYVGPNQVMVIKWYSINYLWSLLLQ